jgi:chromosome segregation ATPase
MGLRKTLEERRENLVGHIKNRNEEIEQYEQRIEAFRGRNASMKKEIDEIDFILGKIE